MRFHWIILLLVIFNFSSVIPVKSQTGLLYKETIESHSRIGGETLRWELSREFILKDYSFEQINESKIVRMEILDNSQYGQLETVIQPLKQANFEIYTSFDEDGRVSKYQWDMYLFRDTTVIGSDPFDSNIRSNFTSLTDHRRFDLNSELNFISVNLEHFEYQVINSKTVKLRVNTELSTNNADNGRVIKSAIHLIKRDGDTIIFEYNWNIQETSKIYRYLNLLDQPYLLVPYQIGLVFIVIMIYIRSYKYWKNNFKIVRKTAGETNSEVEESDEKSTNDRTDNETT